METNEIKTGISKAKAYSDGAKWGYQQGDLCALNVLQKTYDDVIKPRMNNPETEPIKESEVAK